MLIAQARMRLSQLEHARKRSMKMGDSRKNGKNFFCAQSPELGPPKSALFERERWLIKRSMQIQCRRTIEGEKRLLCVKENFLLVCNDDRWNLY